MKHHALKHLFSSLLIFRFHCFLNEIVQEYILKNCFIKRQSRCLVILYKSNFHYSSSSMVVLNSNLADVLSWKFLLHCSNNNFFGDVWVHFTTNNPSKHLQVIGIKDYKAIQIQFETRLTVNFLNFEDNLYGNTKSLTHFLLLTVNMKQSKT